MSYRALLAPLALSLLGSVHRAQCDAEGLVSLDLFAGDRFGVDVDVLGEVAIVGASHDDEGASNTGAAYVFRRSGGDWAQEQKLLSGDPGSSDHFGQAVAIAGDLAVVGVPDDDDVMNSAGSAYVFRFDGASWALEQKLPNPDPSSSARFGWAVATNGAKVAVGSKGDDDLAANSGAIYVFEQSGATWVQDDKLKASDAGLNDQLGDALAYRGDVIVGGAWQESGAGSLRGAAYVFRDGPAGWSEEQKLTASGAADFDWFGKSVAVDGDAVAVGAYRADHLGADGPGAVYVFRRVGGVWIEEQKLVPPDWTGDEDNGWDCAIDGDRVVIGSRSNVEQGPSSGAVYVYDRAGGNWTPTLKLAAPDGAAGDELGAAVALSGTHLFAGASATAAGGVAWAWDAPAPACLAGAPASLSLSAGGQHHLFFAGGFAHASELYLVLGSISGTSPGIPVDGHVLPLNFDTYTLTLLQSPSVIAGGFGLLGPAGEAAATLTVPASTVPGLAGLTAHHACAVFSPLTFLVTATSNAAALALLP